MSVNLASSEGKEVWFMYYMDDFFAQLKIYNPMGLRKHETGLIEQTLCNTVYRACHYLHNQEVYMPIVSLDFEWTGTEVIVRPGNDDTAKLFALYEELLLERELGKS